ncbi:trypsin-like serine protease [Pendulispora brunnea]|uniref:Trypsin-like serine protease n=1 Tax=Pendulispora brunnea TaxID=2905690 RepID=A0ABZ2KIT3_9BACT
MIRYNGAPVSFLSVLGVAFMIMGCAESTENLDRQAETMDRSATPIINGAADNHDEVVSLAETESGAGLCTGTIVATKGSTGYVLTAAHCCEPGALPTIVGVGAAFRTAVKHPITDVLAHPSYSGEASSPYDFCMVSFTGADASTKTIPPIPPELDAVEAGAALDAVGFGRTNTNPQVPLTDPRRLHVMYRVIDFPSDRLITRFDGREGGICPGDSGGPDLLTLGEKTYVFGVHSTVSTAHCNGTSKSGTVSKVYPWIMAYIRRP